ncbi:hypothetical protein [Aquimarina sp. Aq78]|uniref:hypothetical protein n=1 Tax=Aquimarina sp. Aq78 TaxID=1191889 RepID=UPI000D5573F9|nr:hypothetical protein [Aquimarina sp. Aq78]
MKLTNKLNVLVIACIAMVFTGCQKDEIKTVEEELLEIEQQEPTKLQCHHHLNGDTKAATWSRYASHGDAKNVKYFIASSVSSAWSTATVKAAKAWSNSTNGIKMTRTFSKSSANLVIKEGPDPGWDSSPAVAEFPESNGKIGDEIRLNSTYVNPGNAALTTTTRYYIMTHEMGHVFGFQHNNVMSFMKYNFTDADDTWGGMNATDKREIRTQFPN